MVTEKKKRATYSKGPGGNVSAILPLGESCFPRSRDSMLMPRTEV